MALEPCDSPKVESTLQHLQWGLWGVPIFLLLSIYALPGWVPQGPQSPRTFWRWQWWASECPFAPHFSGLVTSQSHLPSGGRGWVGAGTKAATDRSGLGLISAPFVLPCSRVLDLHDQLWGWLLRSCQTETKNRAQLSLFAKGGGRGSPSQEQQLGGSGSGRVLVSSQRRGTSPKTNIRVPPIPPLL